MSQAVNSNDQEENLTAGDPSPCNYGDHAWVRSNHRLGHAGTCWDCLDLMLATDEEWEALPWATADSTSRPLG